MNTTRQQATVVGVFARPEQAEAAVKSLLEAGIPRDEVSLLARKDVEGRASLPETVAGGAVFGGVGGLLLGLAAMALPGMGALLAAGPIATTLAGAGVGAAGGGIAGVLRESGIPHEDAATYERHVGEGSTLVAVHSRDADHQRVAELLDSYGALEVDDEEILRRPAAESTATVQTLGINELAPSGGSKEVAPEEDTRVTTRVTSSNDRPEQSGMGMGAHTLTPNGFVTSSIENPVVARRRARIFGR